MFKMHIKEPQRPRSDIYLFFNAYDVINMKSVDSNILRVVKKFITDSVFNKKITKLRNYIAKVWQFLCPVYRYSIIS